MRFEEERAPCVYRFHHFGTSRFDVSASVVPVGAVRPNSAGLRCNRPIGSNCERNVCTSREETFFRRSLPATLTTPLCVETEGEEHHSFE